MDYKQRLEELIKSLQLDCGDNSCTYKANGPGGMRTNGGCRCADNNPKAVLRLARYLTQMIKRGY